MIIIDLIAVDVDVDPFDVWVRLLLQVLILGALPDALGLVHQYLAATDVPHECWTGDNQSNPCLGIYNLLHCRPDFIGPKFKQQRLGEGIPQ